MSIRRGVPTLWLPIIFRRSAWFLYTVSLIVLLLYLLGNVQEFLDSTQKMLLTLLGVTSFSGGIASLYFAVSLGIRSWFRRRNELPGVLLALCSSLLAFGGSVAVTYLLAWM